LISVGSISGCHNFHKGDTSLLLNAGKAFNRVSYEQSCRNRNLARGSFYYTKKTKTTRRWTLLYSVSVRLAEGLPAFQRPKHSVGVANPMILSSMFVKILSHFNISFRSHNIIPKFFCFWNVCVVNLKQTVILCRPLYHLVTIILKLFHSTLADSYLEHCIGIIGKGLPNERFKAYKGCWSWLWHCDTCGCCVGNKKESNQRNTQ